MTGDRLACAGCGRMFEPVGRVPVMLEESCAPHDASVLARLHYAVLGNPKVYELHQRHCGAHRIAARVAGALEIARGILLDIGAGTGMVAALVPPETQYIWLDNDRLKLRGFLSKHIDSLAVLGDATHLPFADSAADWSVMVEVSHHLPDVALRASLKEAARVTRHRFVFVDALRGDRILSNVMWRLDLGRFPRREDVLFDFLRERFELERIERFRVNHDHVLCVCIPRPGIGA